MTPWPIPPEGAMSQAPAEAYEELIRRVKECRVLESCKSLLDWDEQTYMSPRGSVHRADQVSLLARMSHAQLTAPEVGQHLAAVEASDLAKDADSAPAVNVRDIRRAYDRATKLPERLVQEIARTTTLAVPVWRQARKEN